MYSAGGDKNIIKWDLNNKKQIAKLEGHQDWIYDICISQNDKILFSAGGENIIVWDLEQNLSIKRLIGHTNIIQTISLDNK